MQEAQHPSGRFRFGVFEVDLRAGELRKRGMHVRLQEQPFLVLAMMLEHAGEVVTREDLRKKLWPADTFVDFDHGLNKAINKIRDALGDSSESPRFIETVARRGYRFLAEVRPTDGTPANISEPASSKRPKPSMAWKASASSLVLLLVISIAWTFHSRNRLSPPIRSLAVLPLENIAADATQDYFADGMTDELITHLGQISALRVISRTSVMSYKRTRKPLPEIARELGVDAIVEGSVLRSGNRVRITAQLIEAADKHLWAQTYEGDLGDTLTLQSEVARAIADQIRINVNPHEEATLKNVKVVNPQAYESYLKGRYFWNKRTANGLRSAVAYFNQAIEEEPNYARAYSGLADTYALLGDWEYGVLAPKEAFPKAKAAATKALELDSTLGEAHTSLAFSLDVFDLDWQSAEREFQRAIELSPGYATAHQWYAWHLIVLGRNNEGISEMRKAESLDPLSLIIGADMADAVLIARRYDESIQQSRKTIDMDPNFAIAHYQLGQAYLQKGRNDEAITELRKAVQLSSGSPTCTANLAYAYAVAGRRNEAVKILNDLKNPSNHGFSNPAEIALIYAGLDDKDQAMTWLDKAYQARFNPSILLRPAFDPLRSDPRFQGLLSRMGLNR